MEYREKKRFTRYITISAAVIIVCVLGAGVLFRNEIWKIFYKEKMLVEDISCIEQPRILEYYEEREAADTDIIEIISQIRCREIPFWEKVEIIDNQYLIEFDMMLGEQWDHWTVYVMNQNEHYICSNGDKLYEITNYNDIIERIEDILGRDKDSVK